MKNLPTILGWGIIVYLVIFAYGLTPKDRQENWLTIFIIFFLLYLIYNFKKQIEELENKLEQKEKDILSLINRVGRLDVKRVQLEEELDKKNR